jgi:hypothetical protein
VAAFTEEFYPGFQISICSYTVSLLNKKVVDDLDLYGHGLSIDRTPIVQLSTSGVRQVFESPRKPKKWKLKWPATVNKVRNSLRIMMQLFHVSETFLSPLFLKLPPTLEVDCLAYGDFENLGDDFKP